MDADTNVCIEPEALPAFPTLIVNVPSCLSNPLDTADTNTPLTMKAGAQKIGNADVDIYGALVASQNIDAGGTVQFVVEFITFSCNNHNL